MRIEWHKKSPGWRTWHTSFVQSVGALFFGFGAYWLYKLLVIAQPFDYDMPFTLVFSFFSVLFSIALIRVSRFAIGALLIGCSIYVVTFLSFITFYKDELSRIQNVFLLIGVVGVVFLLAIGPPYFIGLRFWWKTSKRVETD